VYSSTRRRSGQGLSADGESLARPAGPNHWRGSFAKVPGPEIGWPTKSVANETRFQIEIGDDPLGTLKGGNKKRGKGASGQHAQYRTLVGRNGLYIGI
jgi:hypothetical protein